MQTKGWKTIKSKVAYQSPFMTVYEDIVEDELGREHIYSVMDLPDGGTVLPIDPEGNVYLVRQYRYGFGDYSIEVPGGRIDEGEMPEQAAKRELFEELGVEANELISLGTLCSLTSNAKHKEYLYLAKLDHVPEVDPGTEEEVIDLVKVPYEEALRMAEESEIRLSFSVVTILRAEKYLQ